ncbi:uncharacterized protein LOC6541408 [Drosophila erecta]|uniref:UPAR/Ly6 domain-containing protein n=1 Tax=Drosophila erecta TaxID=7220 RepID=B3N7W7_DROER|nr:uncharacterized protein LOC6541408 [Drosophila erecta]EDV58328.1 uncharacterized protein Dere_GG25327 [Drosophila erecta]
MWKNLILGAVLVAFVAVPLANSLTCNKCNSPSGCKSPSSETCSNSTANANKQFLEGYHSNVPAVSGSLNFSCANLTYYHPANYSHTFEFLGCVFNETNVCNLALTNTQSGWSKKCLQCGTDYCNPAGTYSSSVYTIVGSAVVLVLAKVLS